EIDEHERAGAVTANDPIGPSTKAGFVALDLDLERDDRVRLQRANRGRGATIDQSAWQVPQQIDDVRPGGAFDDPAELRPDRRQGRNRSKERVQRGRAHRSSVSK